MLTLIFYNSFFFSIISFESQKLTILKLTRNLFIIITFDVINRLLLLKSVGSKTFNNFEVIKFHVVYDVKPFKTVDLCYIVFKDENNSPHVNNVTSHARNTNRNYYFMLSNSYYIKKTLFHSYHNQLLLYTNFNNFHF